MKNKDKNAGKSVPAAKSPEVKKRKPLTRYNEQKQERLPDGSRFEVRYDAVEVMWSGKLVIRTEGGEEVFESDASGVFKLLSRLDGQYRAWKEGMLWRKKN